MCSSFVVVVVVCTWYLVVVAKILEYCGILYSFNYLIYCTDKYIDRTGFKLTKCNIELLSTNFLVTAVFAWLTVNKEYQ